MSGASPPATGLSSQAIEPPSGVSPVPASIPCAGVFTNADFARVVSKLTATLAGRSADLAYGMWNPLFCSHTASVEAVTFFAALETQAAHWGGAARAAIAIEARSGETGTGSTEGESAAIAPKGAA